MCVECFCENDTAYKRFIRKVRLCRVRERCWGEAKAVSRLKRPLTPVLAILTWHFISWIMWGLNRISESKRGAGQSAVSVQVKVFIQCRSIQKVFGRWWHRSCVWEYRIQVRLYFPLEIRRHTWGNGHARELWAKSCTFVGPLMAFCAFRWTFCSD